jgi:signal transduction histidine kinase
MNSVIGAIILVSIVVHLFLLVYIQVRKNQMRIGSMWLGLTVLFSLLAIAVYFLPNETFAAQFSRGFIRVLLLVAMIAAYGMLVIRDVLNRELRLWLGLVGLWLIGMIIASLLGENAIIGQPEWLIKAFRAPDSLSLVILSGLAVTTLFLLGVTFYAFYIARLPEVANRALFWVLNTAIVVLSVLLTLSGIELWLMAGSLTLLISMNGATYTQASYRVFDIRSSITSTLRALVVIALMAVLIWAVLYTFSVLPSGSRNDDLLVMALLASVAATIYNLGHQFIKIVNRTFLHAVDNPTGAARKYSQQVSKAVELENLIEVSSETLNSVMAVRRSGMLLVSNTSSDDTRVELRVMKGGNFPEIREQKGFVSKSGAIYQRLAAEHAPLSQFDIEFDPLYKTLTEAEREFFRNLQMSAYAPIVVEDVLIGVLICGPKINDAPFYPRDLELLATMADQTGIALRNARLVADLRHLNSSMRSLNTGLEEANEQLEKLDSVKTDFITIASHELRTPLAQIRGYTDIIDALNEQGMLDKDQTAGMVANLRKAIERTEELISAMLDVSQLDVNAMDLRFAQTAPESIVRMAIEPLTDAIKQRKLTLSARGLRGLPTIQADMQRLVQAFRNIVVNAIKFTPDGGRIDITASLQPPEESGGVDQVLVAISDTGVGVDRENLELIFEKFYRAYDPGLHSTGTYKFMGAGPGLGLTIARGVIESHGGKIWAESSGHNMETFPGTTFYVLLPVSPPEDARRVAIEDHSSEGAASSEPTLMRP